MFTRVGQAVQALKAVPRKLDDFDLLDDLEVFLRLSINDIDTITVLALKFKAIREYIHLNFVIAALAV